MNRCGTAAYLPIIVAVSPGSGAPNSRTAEISFAMIDLRSRGTSQSSINRDWVEVQSFGLISVCKKGPRRRRVTSAHHKVRPSRDCPVATHHEEFASKNSLVLTQIFMAIPLDELRGTPQNAVTALDAFQREPH